MFDPRQVSKDFSHAAAQYAEHAVLQQKVLKALVTRSLPQLPKDALILDAGCGTGALALEAKGHRVVQMDIAWAMCQEAAKNRQPIFCGLIESLPFADGIFDAVVSSLVLQWVPHWQKAMQEMQRVLKPGGICAVSTFGPATLKELKESFAAADRYSHVSSFLPREAFEQSEIIMETYPDVFAIMRHLKTIGARNKLLGRRKSLMTPAHMARVARRYEERFGKPGSLPVTWEILSSVMRKS